MVGDRHGSDACGKDFEKSADEFGMSIFGGDQKTVTTRLSNCIQRRLVDMTQYLISQNKGNKYTQVQDLKEYVKGISHMNIIKTMYDILEKVEDYFPLMNAMNKAGATVNYEIVRVDGVDNFFKYHFSYKYKQVIKRDGVVVQTIYTELPFTEVSIDQSFIYDQFDLNNYNAKNNQRLLSQHRTDWTKDPFISLYNRAIEEDFSEEILQPIKHYLLGFPVEHPTLVLERLVRGKGDEKEDELQRLSHLSTISELKEDQWTQLYNEIKGYYKDIDEPSAIWYAENMKRLGDRYIPKKKSKSKGRKSRQNKKSLRKGKK